MPVLRNGIPNLSRLAGWMEKNDPWSHNQNFKENAVTWGCSSIGRAAALQAVGQEFKPPQLHQRTGVGRD